MNRYYDFEKKRLICFCESATPECWDNAWDNDPLPLSEIIKFRRTETSRIVTKYMKPLDGPVLEGGCGRGREVAALHNNGYKVVGVDFAPRTVAQLKAQLPQLDIRQGDMRRLDFPDGFFSGYLSLGVIEHFWDGYAEIASEMARVLKPGGYLFLSFPYMSPLRRLKALLGYYPAYLPSLGQKDFHEFVLDAGEVLREFERRGFSCAGSYALNPIKGFVDEVPSFRSWFWGVHARKERNIAIKAALRLFGIIASMVSGHSRLLVLRKVG